MEGCCFFLWWGNFFCATKEEIYWQSLGFGGRACVRAVCADCTCVQCVCVRFSCFKAQNFFPLLRGERNTPGIISESISCGKRNVSPFCNTPAKGSGWQLWALLIWFGKERSISWRKKKYFLWAIFYLKMVCDWKIALSRVSRQPFWPSSDIHNLHNSQYG